VRNILVTGGAGFLGTNLCEALLAAGDKVVCADNLITGRRKNIASLETNENFSFIEADITKDLPASITGQKYDVIVNMASIGSPPKYFENAVSTLQSGSIGTHKMLELAERDNARFIHTSTSEVYGEPEVHPQPETYWGNVNSYGARSMYDESKRFAEALIWVYRNQKNVNTGIVRIFNTYGPHMDPEDGRVVSNFIIQALKGEPITIYGKGTQTRSFCYVSDQIAGIMALINSDVEGPVNVGNPVEFTMHELADKVLELTGSKSELVYKPLPPDDPTQRKPDITRAQEALHWAPKVPLEEGLKPTIEYFSAELGL
jgi:dTDP-glucose 4,6-dehydratase